MKMVCGAIGGTIMRTFELLLEFLLFLYKFVLLKCIQIQSLGEIDFLVIVSPEKSSSRLRWDIVTHDRIVG